MPDGDPDEGMEKDGARGRWALVNLVVAVMLIAALAAMRLRAELADRAGFILLGAIGFVALVSAGFLFRSLLRR